MGVDDLGHGALTFTLSHRGNAHVDDAKLARAVEEGDRAYIASALHSFVPNGVTWLTEGDQHPVEVVNGHDVRVIGAGRFKLAERSFEFHELLDALERASHASLYEEIS